MTSILEGTLRRSGDRLRITAQLIDAVSGYQLWSAVEFFEKVIEKQPDHAAAYAGKAAALGCLWFFGLSPTAMFLGFADRFDEAMALARRALAGSMVDRQQTVGHGINSAYSGNEVNTETR